MATPPPPAFLRIHLCPPPPPSSSSVTSAAFRLVPGLTASSLSEMVSKKFGSSLPPLSYRDPTATTTASRMGPTFVLLCTVTLPCYASSVARPISFLDKLLSSYVNNDDPVNVVYGKDWGGGVLPGKSKKPQITSKKVTLLKSLGPEDDVIESLDTVREKATTYAKQGRISFYGSEEANRMSQSENWKVEVETKVVYLISGDGDSDFASNAASSDGLSSIDVPSDIPVGWGSGSDVIWYGDKYDEDENDLDASDCDSSDESSSSSSCSSSASNDHIQLSPFVPPPPYDIVRISYLLRRSNDLDVNLYTKVIAILTRDGRLQDASYTPPLPRRSKTLHLTSVSSVKFTPWSVNGGGGSLKIEISGGDKMQTEVFKVCPGGCGDESSIISNGISNVSIGNNSGNAANNNTVPHGLPDSLPARQLLQSWKDALTAGVAKAKEGEFMQLADVYIGENERGKEEEWRSVVGSVFDASVNGNNYDEDYYRDAKAHLTRFSLAVTNFKTFLQMSLPNSHLATTSPYYQTRCVVSEWRFAMNLADCFFGDEFSVGDVVGKKFEGKDMGNDTAVDRVKNEVKRLIRFNLTEALKGNMIKRVSPRLFDKVLEAALVELKHGTPKPPPAPRAPVHEEQKPPPPPGPPPP